MKVAILDDYQNVALKCADWTGVSKRAEITVFNDHVADAEALVARLRPYDVLAVMRERTPLRRDIIGRLPNLKMIAAAAERGIIVTHSSYSSTPTVELTWALILAGARHITAEAAAVRAGKWQHTIGEDMAERTLGIVGLGSIGARVAKVAQAFGMNVIAWSQNLTAEKAAAGGAKLVSKEELFRQADVVSTFGPE
jgi:phosphoglycerate dehydrogenase-like enzyme